MDRQRQQFQNELAGAASIVNNQLSRLKMLDKKFAAMDKDFRYQIALNIKAGNNSRAKALANELSNIRRVQRTTQNVGLALEVVVIRFSTINEFAMVMETINPTIELVKDIQKEISNVVPSANGVISEVSSITSDVLINSNVKVDMNKVSAPIDSEAVSILNEVEGILEAASKRVRMIFSVMASPNRIDILRILNSKGPLTYSELKSLAGFKSKKESGKFAYHLRKLLRQSLVALNKAERRYTITNLGKLVLSLARQIEERSIIESGKMYVRTTRHSIEEFNSHKIIQSLVREANMPLEQANKITEEVENKIYKFQTSYLTSSLIRETVNSVLIEHGHEEYRNKLARLGLPTSDIVEMLNNIDIAKNGIDSIMSKASQSVFSEHLMLNILPKDIADMHLNGEISISNSGIWSLLPDTVFLNIADFAEVGLDLKGKFLNVSRIPAIKNSDDIGIALPILISLLSREVSTEIVLDGIIPLLLEDQTREPNEIASRFENILIASSVAPSYSPAGFPVTTITVQLDKFDKKSIDAVLSGYRSYIASTPI